MDDPPSGGCVRAQGVWSHPGPAWWSLRTLRSQSACAHGRSQHREPRDAIGSVAGQIAGAAAHHEGSGGAPAAPGACLRGGAHTRRASMTEALSMGGREHLHALHSSYRYPIFSSSVEYMQRAYRLLLDLLVGPLAHQQTARQRQYRSPLSRSASPCRPRESVHPYPAAASRPSPAGATRPMTRWAYGTCSLVDW